MTQQAGRAVGRIAIPRHEINKINSSLDFVNLSIDFVNWSWYTYVQTARGIRTQPLRTFGRETEFMAQTFDVTDECPVCGGMLIVTQLTCERCSSSLAGSFRLASAPIAGSASRGDETRFGRLARLDATQLEFVETFLRCRGIIKNVEDMLGISYPTVKARLAGVLETMGVATDEDIPAAARRRAQRRKILADLAEGRITTEEAHTLLLNLQAAPESVDDADDVNEEDDEN